MPASFPGHWKPCPAGRASCSASRSYRHRKDPYGAGAGIPGGRVVVVRFGIKSGKLLGH